MKCPFCGESDTSVKDSRTSDDEAHIKRRRSCSSCGGRFTTLERIELRQLMVIKRDGSREAFNRDKMMRSIMTALRKRPIDPGHVERFVNALIRQLETRGEAEITTQTVGSTILEALSSIDPVAYIRFASVYQDFGGIEDFTTFIHTMERG